MSPTTERRVAHLVGAGEPERVVTVVNEEVPTPGPDRVLVSLAAAAVNHSENLAMAGGAYAAKLTFPQPLGYEGAGTVLAAGPGVELSPGTRVCFIGPGAGCCADLATVPAAMTVPIPDDLALSDAARVLAPGLTARLLTRVRDLSGATVAVWGAAGPVGRMLTAFLTEAGATVIGIASGGRVADVRAVGGTHAIDRSTQDVAAAVRELTDGGADAVYDPVGATTYRTSLDLLAPRGLYVSFGQLCGSLPKIDLMDLMDKGIQVTKAGGGRAFMDDFAEIPALLAGVVDAVVANPALVSPIGGEFPLSRVTEAYRQLADGTTGKILVVPDPA